MNSTRLSGQKPDPLLERYHQVVQRYGLLDALHVPGGEYTFADLDIQSEQIASLLLASGCSECVIYDEPSIYYFASLIACMKTGITAIPLDPHAMNTDKNLVLTNFDDLLCLTNREFLSDAKQHFHLPCVLFNEKGDTDQPTNVQFVVKDGELTALHRVFTSGSTGNSNLVTMNRISEYVHYQEASEIYEYTAGKKYSNFFRHVYSSMINAFWRVLLSGSCFVCMDLKKQTSSEIYQKLMDSDVNGLQGPSTLLGTFIEKWQGLDRLTAVDSLIFGGEPLNPKILNLASNLLNRDCKVIFNYSTTETMLISVFKTTLSEVLNMNPIPVGTPVPSKSLKLMDEKDNEVKKGEFGEVVITSKFIASDIIGNLSESKLIQTPNQPGFRTYFTGDLAVWNSKGQLVHLGRLDNHFKINGVRIDTQSIQIAIEKIKEVRECVVLPLEMDHFQIQLVAGIVWEGERMSDSEIYRNLSTRLDSSHIPAHILDLEKIPVSITGKKDLKRLKELFLSQILNKNEPTNGNSNRVDKSSLRKYLEQEWTSILKKSVNENSHSFFSEGGDSLAVVELITTINTKFKLDLEPIWVFKNPTLSEQVDALREVRSVTDEEVSSASQADKKKLTVNEIKNLLGW